MKMRPTLYLGIAQPRANEPATLLNISCIKHSWRKLHIAVRRLILRVWFFSITYFSLSFAISMSIERWQKTMTLIFGGC